MDDDAMDDLRLAEAILRKILTGGWVDLENGTIDVRVSLTAEEMAYLDSVFLRGEESDG